MAEVADISLGGVCLWTTAPLQISSRYALQLPAGAADGVRLCAEVLWAEEIGVEPPDSCHFRSGLRFTDLDGRLQGGVSEQIAGHC
jgi:hypothetical protein